MSEDDERNRGLTAIGFGNLPELRERFHQLPHEARLRTISILSALAVIIAALTEGALSILDRAFLLPLETSLPILFVALAIALYHLRAKIGLRPARFAAASAFAIGLSGLLLPRPLPPAPVATLCVSLLSTATFLMTFDGSRNRHVADWLTFLSALCSGTTLLAFLFRVSEIEGIQSATAISSASAASLVLLAFGVLFADSRRGAAGVLAAENASGEMVRWFLPGTLASTVLVGLLVAAAADRDLFSRQFALPVFAELQMILLLLLIWRSAARLQSIDDIRANAELELRAEREFLEKVLDFSGILVAVVDSSGTLVRVNHGFVHTSGYSERESVGRSIFDLIIPEDRKQQAREDLKKALREGLVDHEVEMLTRSGILRTILWKVDVLTGSSETYLIASGVDLTDLREAEDQRLRLEMRLQHNERVESLGRVAATITHEFNNVLMGIQPFAEIVEKLSGNDPKLMMCSANIRQAIQRGTRITREVLRFARPSVPVRSRIPVCSWLMTLIGTQRVALGQDIRIDLDCGRAISIEGDQSQLEQVIVNLLLNARDAMEGTGRISVSAGPVAAPIDRFGVAATDKRYVQISVGDEGPGIPREVRERLFEPFFTTKPRGTGLGLPVSEQILRSHGGYLVVDSQPGEGSTFHLFLPVE